MCIDAKVEERYPLSGTPEHVTASRHYHQNIVSPHRICRSHTELGLNIQLPHTLTSLICSNLWHMQQFRYQKYFWPSRKLPVTLRMTALSVRWKICLFGQLSFYLHTAPLVSTGALSVIKYKPSISPASVHPMLTVGGVTISWPLSGAECCCCCCCWVLIS